MAFIFPVARNGSEQVFDALTGAKIRPIPLAATKLRLPNSPSSSNSLSYARATVTRPRNEADPCETDAKSCNMPVAFSRKQISGKPIRCHHNRRHAMGIDCVIGTAGQCWFSSRHECLAHSAEHETDMNGLTVGG
jgi:hypothetical protein